MQAFWVQVAFGDEAGGRWGDGGREGFEGLVKTFAIFCSRPRQISSHGECIPSQCATGAELSLSKENEMEGKEDTEEAAMYPGVCHVLLVVERSVRVGEQGWLDSGSMSMVLLVGGVAGGETK